MATENVDPVDWSVDQVVNFLCHSGPAPWAQSSNTPRPDPVRLEAALRENEMSGEVLMYVDNEGLKDLGVKAYGQRISLMRAVQWLKSKSSKHNSIQQGDHETVENTHTEKHSSLGHVSFVPVATSPVITAPSQPSGQDPGIVGKGQKPKRRIAPMLVQPAPQPISPEQTTIGDTLLQSGVLQEPEINFASLGEGAPSGTRTRKEEDFLDSLARKWKDDSSSPLPLYGESGSEDELDLDTWHEVVADNPNLDTSKPSISREQCSSFLAQYITEKEEQWYQEHLPKELPGARAMWMYFRQSNTLEREKDRLCVNIVHLDSRLSKLQEGILSVEYRSSHALRKSCGSMDMTIYDQCLEKWRLSILTLDVCPQKVSRPDKAPRSRVTREVEPGDDETLGSETESLSGQTIDEELTSDETDSDPSEIEQVDLGHESLSHVSIYSDNETSRAQSKEPRSEPALTPSLPFSLGSSPPSSDGELPHPPSKRQRVREVDQSGHVKAPQKAPPTAFSLDDDEDLSDIDIGSVTDPITRLASPSQSMQQDEDHEMDEALIKTPLLNPILPTDNMVKDIMVKTPPLNPTKPSRLILTLPRPPEAISNKSSPQSRRSSFGLAISLSDLSSEGSPAPAEENSPSVDAEHGELFQLLERTSMESIMAKKDRIQLLAKSVMQLRSSEINEFDHFLDLYFPDIYVEGAQEAVRAMLKNKRELEGDNQQEGKLFMRLGALFVSWYHCVTLDPIGIQPKLLKDALEEIQPGDKTPFDTFFKKFRELVSAYKKWNPKLSRRGSSTAKSPTSQNTTSKPSHRHSVNQNPLKRKKHSQILKLQNDAQQSAQHRKAKQDKAREAFRRARDRLGLSNSDPAGQAVSFKEPIIYLNPGIGEFVKPHQLLGIQFMWRELCDTGNMQGCLLAHVMGLGKTMQVISLLVTISEAAASKNPQIRAQVPQKFHRSQTLILCPSALTHNWREELEFWAPHDHLLGNIYDVSPSFTPDPIARLDILQAWKNQGGILILSYDLFRRFVSPPSSSPYNEAEKQIIQDLLLSTPSIVVADEAHRLKSDISAITKVASRIKTTSRIAMTGSPLANNLMEYYQMIDWIAPGYLETPTTFKEKFIEPIQAGLYLDSTRSQRRAGLIALKLLNCIMEPKVNRASISAIASDLPMKTEFIIRVPLTETQKAAYNIFVQETKFSGGLGKLWQWLAIMQLCCNHPLPFRNKLMNRMKEKDEDSSVLPRSIDEAGLPSLLFEKIEDLFQGIPDLSDPSLSHRAVLLGRILDESKKVGDKVLIFSQSIPTLHYLDMFLKQRKCAFKRIDGSTPALYRQQTTKSFNHGDDTQAILISTRAGGIGLNMFGANRVIIFDFLFNPTWEEQAVGRAYRLGQKKPVFVYRFVASGTFEDVIHNKVVFKSQLSVRVVDKKNVLREGEKKRTEYLFPVKEKEQESLGHVVGKDHAVLDRIINSTDAANILGITLSTLQDDENDRLTQQEHEEVQAKLSLDVLRRTDPKGYALEIEKRERVERLATEAARLRYTELARTHEAQASVTNSPSFSNALQRDQHQPPGPAGQANPTQGLLLPQPSVPTPGYFNRSTPTISGSEFLGSQQGLLETQMRQSEVQTHAFRSQWERDLPLHQHHTNDFNLADPRSEILAFPGNGYNPQFPQPSMPFMPSYGTEDYNLPGGRPPLLPLDTGFQANSPNSNYFPLSEPAGSPQPRMADRSQSVGSYFPTGTMPTFEDFQFPTNMMTDGASENVTCPASPNRPSQPSSPNQGQRERAPSVHSVASANISTSMDISAVSEPPTPTTTCRANQLPTEAPKA